MESCSPSISSGSSALPSPSFPSAARLVFKPSHMAYKVGSTPLMQASGALPHPSRSSQFHLQTLSILLSEPVRPSKYISNLNTCPHLPCSRPGQPRLPPGLLTGRLPSATAPPTRMKLKIKFRNRSLLCSEPVEGPASPFLLFSLVILAGSRRPPCFASNAPRQSHLGAPLLLFSH